MYKIGWFYKVLYHLKSLSRRLLVGRRGEVVGPGPPPTRTVQLPIGFLAVEVEAPRAGNFLKFWAVSGFLSEK